MTLGFASIGSPARWRQNHEHGMHRADAAQASMAMTASGTIGM
jgi:hypothetical protein